MISRPILFSGPMVRAILDGRKTQTRRVVQIGTRSPVEGPWELFEPGTFGAVAKDGTSAIVTCPYGVPGDRLWVREAFYVQPELWAETYGQQPIHYCADTRREEVEDYVVKPSIYMPRWASRITLEVTGVRVERLQQINEADAMAEGARHWPEIPDPHPYKQGARWSMAAEAPPNTEHCLGTARFAFGSSWNATYAKRGLGWDANPWVWVVEFKRVGGGE